ncbi:hypothetical protein [Psychromonas sp. L1A2]|nr:hypothetical protein [Psychromonas sp. L1A2]
MTLASHKLSIAQGVAMLVSALLGSGVYLLSLRLLHKLQEVGLY